jgi:hypothetical protein
MLAKLRSNLLSAPRLLVVFVGFLLAAYFLRTIFEPDLIGGVGLIVWVCLIWFLLDRNKVARVLSIIVSLFLVLTTWIFVTNLPVLFSQTIYFAAFATYLLFSRKYRAWLSGLETNVKD